MHIFLLVSITALSVRIRTMLVSIRVVGITQIVVSIAEIIIIRVVSIDNSVKYTTAPETIISIYPNSPYIISKNVVLFF